MRRHKECSTGAKEERSRNRKDKPVSIVVVVDTTAAVHRRQVQPNLSLKADMSLGLDVHHRTKVDCV